MVYTGTIDAFYGYRFGKLEYRSLRFESQVLDRENHQGVAVVNYTDRDTQRCIRDSFQVDMIGYQAQVLPAVLAGFTLVYLERFFRKICPAMISMIVVPFCSLLISVAVAHGILGPVSYTHLVGSSLCTGTGCQCVLAVVQNLNLDAEGILHALSLIHI